MTVATIVRAGGGLGLAIAHSIGRADGGGCAIRSDAGVGTICVVRLPVVRLPLAL